MRKINLPRTSERSGVIPQGSVFVDHANMKRESVMLDRDGNEIDLRTKSIIKRKAQDE